MRVLVVDDSMVMRRVVIDALRSFSDAEVVESGSAEEALEVMRSGQGPGVDLVLLDWYLPGVSGLEALRLMQGDPRLAKIPVVMVTSERAKANVIAALRTGAKNYIVKPFQNQVFRKKVGPFLEKKEVAPADRAGSTTGSLAGNLAQTSPLEVIQLISMTKKSGILVFEGAGGKGRFSLYFKSGQIAHAEGEGVTGEDAVLVASGLSDGQFTFQATAPEKTTQVVSIRRSTDMIMLDAFKQSQG
ncbi:MAG: response regulator [Planctomycetota bacterium]|jgi:two-component system chemotaxis response regulator CheY